MPSQNDLTGKTGERRLLLAVVALLAIAVSVQYGGGLFGQGVYHFDDAADTFYPAREAARRALGEGTLPGWEPGAWGGWPLMVDPNVGIFYPPNAIFYVLGSARGLVYSVALHALLAGLGLFAFLRRRNLSAPAALVGALAFALCSFMVVRVRHIDFIQLAAWIPWFLWGLDRWLDERRLRVLVWLALFIGLALLSGALTLVVVAAFLVLGYFLPRLFYSWRARPKGQRWRCAGADLILLSLAAAAGITLAAVQLLPVIAHLPHSPRAMGTSYEFASSYAWPNIRYALTLLVPDLYGNDHRAGGYGGAFNYWELAGYYVGVGTYLLAACAVFWRAPEGRRGRAELLILTLLALIAVGTALGGQGPIHRLLYDTVPLFDSLRSPPRTLLILLLVLPILAAHGTQALLNGLNTRAATDRRQFRRWVVLALAVLLISTCAAILLQLPDRGPRFAGGLRALTWAILVGAIVVLRAFDRLAPRIFAVLLCVVLPVDLLAQNFNYLRAQPATYPAGSERLQALQWLQRNDTSARFVNHGSGPFRLHNIGMVHGLQNASGYNSVPIWRYRNLLYIIAHGRPYPYPRLRTDLNAPKIRRFDSPLLDLLNVRYVVTHGVLPKPRFQLAFSPDAWCPSLAPFEPHWDRVLRVYENRHVLPRAFVVHRYRLFNSEKKLAQAISATGFQPSAEVLLEEKPAIEPQPLPPTGPSFTAARIQHRERHRMVVKAKTDRAGLLVLSEVHYPGWSARINGKPVPILRANYALRAVALPRGNHTIEFRYHNRALITGAWLSAGSAGLLLLLLLMGWVRRPLHLFEDVDSQ